MTGFGKASAIVGNKKIVVEIKSVNSKGLDINAKLPSIYKEKEIDIRKLIGNKLLRGKVECSVYFDVLEQNEGVSINRPLIAAYLKEIKNLENEHGVSTADHLSLVMKMPDVYKAERAVLGDAEWQGLKALVEEARDNLDSFRLQEGNSLKADFEQNVGKIMSLLADVEPYETARIEQVKTRISQNLEEVVQKSDIDQNRFEQELIYYIEKFDINEEKVRLSNHCSYFNDTMTGPDGNGKKLGFIAQEMGREINTLGSKANHAEIQKIVVQMKDALEKIKEQVLNAL